MCDMVCGMMTEHSPLYSCKNNRKKYIYFLLLWQNAEPLFANNNRKQYLYFCNNDRTQCIPFIFCNYDKMQNLIFSQ